MVSSPVKKTARMSSERAQSLGSSLILRILPSRPGRERAGVSVLGDAPAESPSALGEVATRSRMIGMLPVEAAEALEAR
ncbi:hypothetical protein [Nesterenkonia lutea]|uniref:Uncharacterized protein n=1 Tax=Nesterenkonia lutea TaxID=272919 RepID=A0ABR9JGC7_9MICC|nr:hypothetical protein [Nesterenkonia lutea]MBE1524517.1 hypothetical protein [Nesterenkonia lutea]